jgi:hypothetical protein
MRDNGSNTTRYDELHKAFFVAHHDVMTERMKKRIETAYGPMMTRQETLSLKRLEGLEWPYSFLF